LSEFGIIVRMTTAQQLITAEEFAQLPESPGGEQMELVRGLVVMAPPADIDHGERAFEIGVALREFVRRHKLGRITGEGGYLLVEDPDVVRAPDTAWLSGERRERESPRTSGYFKGAPNLAVEVVSTHDREIDIDEKVSDYLAAGTDRVWVVRPKHRTVTVHRPGGDSHRYTAQDTLTSDDAGFPVTGFELPVAAIFE
jgi:Uma2 family endonuclease